MDGTCRSDGRLFAGHENESKSRNLRNSAVSSKTPSIPPSWGGEIPKHKKAAAKAATGSLHNVGYEKCDAKDSHKEEATDACAYDDRP